MREELVRTGYSGTGLLLAFAAGAAIGTIAALLFAPAPGDETRRRVRDAAREAARKPRDLARRIPGVAHDTAAAAEEAFGEALAEPH